MIGLCQFAAAEEVLDEILKITPDDINSQLYLGIVQAMRRAVRFPASAATAVEKRMEELLEEWQIGEGDLAICSGLTEGDVMFGEKCIARKAKVRLLILEPTLHELANAPSDPAAITWATRASSLVDSAEIWYHRTELGDPVENTSAQGRHNRWNLNTARMEAEKSDEDTSPPAATTRLYGLILSDGRREETDTEHPSFLISELRASNSYEGQVLNIDPRHF